MMQHRAGSVVKRRHRPGAAKNGETTAHSSPNRASVRCRPWRYEQIHASGPPGPSDLPYVGLVPGRARAARSAAGSVTGSPQLPARQT